MNRIIVDFKKLTEDILNLLVEKYPDGYNDSDIITFKNASGEIIEAVEVRTEETIYLVKVSVKHAESMENFMDEEEEDEVTGDVPEDKEIDFGEVSDEDETDSGYNEEEQVGDELEDDED